MTRVAVLCSGGVDSTVLLADLCASGARPVPLHLRAGYRWEDAEARTLGRLLAESPLRGHTDAVETLRLDAADVLPPDHWAYAGDPPAWGSHDRDVHLDGRNLLLLTRAAVWCARHDVTHVFMASLAGNPFPDATPAFFEAMGRAASLGLARPLLIQAPYLGWSKAEVIARGRVLSVPLVQTLSCLRPTVDDGHCLACSKCRERFDAFTLCGLPTPDQ